MLNARSSSSAFVLAAAVAAGCATGSTPGAGARPSDVAAPSASPAPPRVETSAVPPSSAGLIAGIPPAPRTGPPAPSPLTAGEAAPDFEAVAHDGKKLQLSKLAGKLVVVYFYPKDETPGCTKEACELRDSWAALEKAGVVVIGVSGDDAASHKAFAEHHKLPFSLVPDTDGAIAKKFGVPVVDGYARRVTFLVGRDGKILRTWPKVNPVGHAAEILAEVTGKGT